MTTYYETEVGGICVQIIDLYVNENARGKGVATQYFNYLFDKYSGAKCFRLEVVKDNVKAISLYKKMGFTLLRKEKNPIGQGFYMDDYVLELKL